LASAVALSLLPGLSFATWFAPDWFWVQKVESLSSRLVLDRLETYDGRTWRLLCWRNHAEPDAREYTGVILPGDGPVATFKLSTVRAISAEDCRNLLE
jgi:hypothetical protein